MVSVKLVEVIQTERIDCSDPRTANRKIVEIWSKDGNLIARDEQRIKNGGEEMLNPLTKN